MVWKVDKNSSDWLNKSASSGSLSHWCVRSVATDPVLGWPEAALLWEGGTARKTQSHSCHLLFRSSFSLYSIPEVSIQAHQSSFHGCDSVRRSLSTPPRASSVGFRSLCLGQWQLYCLQLSKSRGGYSDSYLKEGPALPPAASLCQSVDWTYRFVILYPRDLLSCSFCFWIPLGQELWQCKLASERKTHLSRLAGFF